MSNENLDILILKELVKDARQSFRAIAKKLGIATTTVINRYEKMKKSGVIKNASIVVDYEKLGYGILAMIELIVSRGRFVDVEESLSRRRNVCAVYGITGDTDAIILARFRDRQELNAFVKSLSTVEHIERANTHVVLEVMKEDMNSVI